MQMTTIMDRFKNDESSVSLAEYLSCFDCLTQDLDHWTGMGITTATELGDYLDGCVAREHEHDDIMELVERKVRRRREQNRRAKRRIKHKGINPGLAAFNEMMLEAGL